jgi:TRAP-type transport system periplasmic protein
MKKRNRWTWMVVLICTLAVLGPAHLAMAAAQGKILIKIGLAVSKAHTEYLQCERFKEIVEKESKGEIAVDIYAGGQLGSNVELFEAVKLGALQVTTTASSFTTASFSESGIFDLPFLFRDFEHADQVFDGTIGQGFGERFYKKLGLRIIGYSSSGFQGFYDSKRPIRSIEDIKGLKMRTMESPVLVDSMNAYGAKAVSMALTEFYTAMQQGVVDGGENSIVTYETQKHYEVAKYFTDSKHKYLPMLLVISGTFFQSLPEPYQKLMIDAGAQSALHARRIYAHEIEEKTKKAQAGGAIIGRLNPGAENDFQKVLEPVYKKYGERISGGMEMIGAIQKSR